MAKRPTSAVRPPPADSRPLNRLLRALPAADLKRLMPDMETVVVKTRQVLHRAGEPLKHVYFPNRGAFSITTVMPDGTMVEVATIGEEGMLGIEACFGTDAVAPGEAFLQVPDESSETTAVKLSVAAFRRELSRLGALHTLMGRYSQIVIAQMMQSTACNALHHVQERCARWLLMTHDRMHMRDFHLSHEFLAIMLGVRRPTVTVVAGALQQSGLITYKHGRVTVRDRKGLEAAACPCYAVGRANFERMRT